MKRIRNMAQTEFLRCFFLLVSASFLLAAFCMPDRKEMLSGLWRILVTPGRIPHNYFAVGGFSATFLNMGLVGLCCLGLYVVFHARTEDVSNLAFLLTVGFGSWGINILNIWPTIFGVMLFGLVKKEPQRKLVVPMLFSTGIAPLISELLFRYPGQTAVGFHLTGVLLSLAVGFVIGFFLTPRLHESPMIHKGYSLYSAALPVGLTALFLNSVLYRTMGVALPPEADPASLSVASATIANTFCLCLFGLFIVLARLLGCTAKEYLSMLRERDAPQSLSAHRGNAVFLMNAGIFGLFILGYYNLIGASFSGPIFGVMFCMLSTCDSGSNPANVWPMMVGYLATSQVCSWLSSIAGGTFVGTINSAAICIGLCYSNGMSPICRKYGWQYGILAGVMHYLLVMQVPSMHGGFCLYNGGFTACMICMILIPVLERFKRPLVAV